MKNKRAEMSIGMIVGVIVIVATFAILALVYSQLTWTGNIDREVCKQSAIMRGTIPEKLPLEVIKAKEIVSLTCKTKKICVTTNSIFQGKGDCTKVFGDGEGKFSTYRISSDKIKAEQQIKTLLAREMADCWDMMGRGNLAIFNRELNAKGTEMASVAVICSRIHFDDSITSEDKLNLSKLTNMNEYLLKHKVPNYEISYWDFLRNAYDGETMAILHGQTVKGDSEVAANDFLNDKLDLTNTKTILYLETRPDMSGALVGAFTGGAVALVGTLFFGGGVGTAGPMIGGASVIGGAIGEWIQLKDLEKKGLFPSDAKYASAIFLTDYSYEGFQTLKIKKEDKVVGDLAIASIP